MSHLPSQKFYCSKYVTYQAQPFFYNRVSLQDPKNTVKAISSKTSAGLDGLSMEIFFKYIFPYLAQLLLLIIQQIIQIRYFSCYIKNCLSIADF